MYIKLSKPKLLLYSFKHYKKLYKNKIKQYNGVLSSIRKREHWVWDATWFWEKYSGLWRHCAQLCWFKGLPFSTGGGGVSVQLFDQLDPKVRLMSALLFICIWISQFKARNCNGREKEKTNKKMTRRKLYFYCTRWLYALWVTSMVSWGAHQSIMVVFLREFDPIQ